MGNKKVLKIASAGKRFGAWVIDEVIFWVAIVVCALFMSIPVGVIGESCSSGLFGGILGFTMVGLFMIAGLAYLIVQLYFYSKGQSIGKTIVGLRVVHKKDGTPLSFWWMLLRELVVKKASEVVFCLGYIWILIDDNRQGWHDKILDTYVIDEKETASLVHNVPETPVKEVKFEEPKAEKEKAVEVKEETTTEEVKTEDVKVEDIEPETEDKKPEAKPEEDKKPAPKKKRAPKKAREGKPAEDKPEEK